MATARAVLDDPDLLNHILQRCTCRGIGRAARICKTWREKIRGKLDKEAMRQWLIAASTTGTTVGRGEGGNWTAAGKGGRMTQVWLMNVLHLNRQHCMAMHGKLGMAAKSCTGGYPIPATFDLAMDASAPRARWLFEDTPYMHNCPVEPGWDAFLRRVTKHQEYREAEAVLAQTRAKGSHSGAMNMLAKRRTVEIARMHASLALNRLHLIETQQPLPQAGVLAALETTKAPLAMDHEAAATYLKAQLEAAAKAIGTMLECNAHLKQQPNVKQARWYLGRASHCRCECAACNCVRTT